MDKEFEYDSSEIERLIAEEQDPKARLYLLVLNRINTSLLANTSTVKKVSERLEEHLEKFESRTKEQDAIANKGRGAWKILAWVLGLLQMLVIGFAGYIMNDIRSIHDSILEISTEQARRTERIRYLEEFVDRQNKNN